MAIVILGISLGVLFMVWRSRRASSRLGREAARQRPENATRFPVIPKGRWFGGRRG